MSIEDRQEKRIIKRGRQGFFVSLFGLLFGFLGFSIAIIGIFLVAFSFFYIFIGIPLILIGWAIMIIAEERFDILKNNNINEKYLKKNKIL